MLNFVNFHPTSQSLEMSLPWVLLSIVHEVWVKTIQGSYLSWHWTVMQNLNKPWPCGFKNGMRKSWIEKSYKLFLVNFHATSWKSGNLHFQLKSYRRLSLATLKNDAKFEEKLTFCLKNEIRNLVQFNVSSGKFENLHFDGLLL